MKFAVITSLLLSILATILFLNQKLGVSVVIFVVILMCITIYLLKKHTKLKNKKGCLLIIPIVLLSATYAIYQNTFFKILNILIMLVLYNIMLIWVIEPKCNLEFNSIKRIFMIAIKPFNYIKQTCKAIEKVFKKDKAKQEEKNKDLKVLKQIIIGIGTSIPITIIVISLLGSADSIFKQEMQNICEVIFKNTSYLINNQFWFLLTARLLIICALTIYFISFIINILSKNPYKIKNEAEVNIQIEQSILNTIVTILNIIYFIFCKIQITNLFTKIATGQIIDYANYARNGFFQLMAVSIINFIIIIITTKNKKKTSKIAIYYSKIMNLLLAISTIIICASAFIRMNLYGQEFGYTFLRILVYFTLITESILIIPTIVYIINNKFSPWKSYFVITVIMYVIMNYSNINKMIVTKNINRYLYDNKKVDVVYLTKTKTDGIEEVLKLYEQTNDQNIKMYLEKYFKNLKISLEQKENIVEWNYSKWKAKNLLEKF